MKLYETKIRGQSVWCVDLRKKGKGQRKFFDTREKARHWMAKRDVDGRAPAGENWEVSQADRKDLLLAHSIATTGGFTVLEAVRNYTGGKKTISRTLDAARSEFMQSKCGIGRRQSYIENLECILRMFAKGRGGMMMSRITTADLDEWLRRPGYKPQTRQGMQRRLATFFAWGKKMNYIEEDPALKLEVIRVTPEPPAIFKAEQVSALLSSAVEHDRELVPWIVLAVFCGIRPHEINRLDAGAIKLEYVEVSAAASKVHARRLVPLEDNAAAWLRAFPVGKSLKLVNHRRRMKLVRARSGLDKFPHDVLRHTAASFLLAKHRSADDVALRLGNSPAILFRHYRELVTPEESERFWAIMPPEATKVLPLQTLARSNTPVSSGGISLEQHPA